VGSSTRTDLDFTVERHADGSLWFAPARSGVTMMLYSSAPVVELTSIDRAPQSGFGSVTIEAVPGYAYIFRVAKADGIHFAAIRVAFETSEYVVFDWAYQQGSGNAELSRTPANKGRWLSGRRLRQRAKRASSPEASERSPLEIALSPTDIPGHDP
jgi:hypothetical protein